MYKSPYKYTVNRMHDHGQILLSFSHECISFPKYTWRRKVKICEFHLYSSVCLILFVVATQTFLVLPAR